PYNVALKVFINFSIVVTPSLYRGLVMPPFFIPSAPLIALPSATTHINCGWYGNTKNSHFRKSEKLSISTGCAGNMISITSRPALSVTVFIRIVNTSQVYN
ncbi:TPA: hypothetical protein ACWCH9_005774, partial [Escherichia coli]